MNKEQGNQLKALGALAVIAAHVGYFIFSNNISGPNFLFPFSNYAGVAVNLFYFLSAYGLAVSASKTGEMGIISFYKKRFLRLVPLIWAVLALFFVLDLLIYTKGYSTGYIIRSFFLIFPTADLWGDVNSPLWYITPLIAYYLLFPFLFRKGKVFLSAILFLIFGCLLAKTAFVSEHFNLHFIAFSVGILFAGYGEAIGRYVRGMARPVRLAASMILLILLGVGSIYSGVGTAFEQYASILIMLVLVSFFLFSSFNSRPLAFVGTFSFELYLLHWPLLSRFDLLSGLRSWEWIWFLAWIIVLLGTVAVSRRMLKAAA